MGNLRYEWCEGVKREVDIRYMISKWCPANRYVKSSSGRHCDNYRASGALEKLEHETILQDRASDR